MTWDFEQIVAFARQFKASITLLYVVQQYYLPGDFTGGLDYAALEKEIEELRKELEALGREEEVEPLEKELDKIKYI